MFGKNKTMMIPQINPFAFLALIALPLGKLIPQSSSSLLLDIQRSVLIQQDITFGIELGGVVQTIVLNDWVITDPLNTGSAAIPSNIPID